MRSLNLPYNPRIDQLRWLAVTLVFLFHFYLEYRGLGGREIATASALFMTVTLEHFARALEQP